MHDIVFAVYATLYTKYSNISKELNVRLGFQKLRLRGDKPFRILPKMLKKGQSVHGLLLLTRSQLSIRNII